MKAKILILSWFFGAFLRANSQGYIVPNGVTYVGLNFLGGYEIQVLQNPTNGNYTGFMLTPEGRTPPETPYINTFSYDHFVDEGIRVFLVSANQPISEQTIQSGSYTELMTLNSYLFASGSPFYVGLYTGEFFPQNGVYPDPMFGWARLVNSQGVIQMLDSALAYKSGGIYVGTQNLIQVPEPSSTLVLTLGMLVLGCRKKAMRRRPWCRRAECLKRTDPL